MDAIFAYLRIIWWPVTQINHSCQFHLLIETLILLSQSIFNLLVQKTDACGWMVITGITLAQKFRATSRLRSGDLERCFNKQGDTRLHVAAVLTR